MQRGYKSLIDEIEMQYNDNAIMTNKGNIALQESVEIIEETQDKDKEMPSKETPLENVLMEVFPEKGKM